MAWLWIAGGLLLLAVQMTTLWLVVFYGVRIMADLAEVHAAIADQTQAIEDLEAAMPGPPAATTTDLEQIKLGIEANTAHIRAIEIPGKP